MLINCYSHLNIDWKRVFLLLCLFFCINGSKHEDRSYPVFKQEQKPELNLLHDEVVRDEENQHGYGLPPPSSPSRGSHKRGKYQIPEVARDKNVNNYGAVPNFDSSSHSAYSPLNRDPAGGTAIQNLENEKQVVTAVPDLSDPCFRRYANSIVVNAQPFERRSSISLVQCKNQCLLSQIGVYSCRSFVYDNVNQVCDLFAHVGDQSPARLLRFQTRDYFEPTSAVTCKPTFNDATVAPALALSPTLPTSIFEQTQQQQVVETSSRQTTIETNTNTFQETVSELTPPIDIADLPTSAPDFTATTTLLSINQLQIADQKNAASCENGQIPRFLKTADFELHNHDDMRLEGVSLNECIDFCSTNFAVRDNGSSIKCNSFEYNNSGSVCILTSETAVPLGNGQLKQKQATDYYEKVCVDEKLAGECPSAVYNRFPQMILVGFAETVVDAPSLQHCFDNCLNSRQLYGFRCASGMYYFEEPQLNCILNTEDRNSQPDLFTSENSDLVDYFETSCNQSSAANRRFASPSANRNSVSLKKKDFVEKSPLSSSRTKYGGLWTEWSSCSRNGTEPAQIRHKICGDRRICGRDVRACDSPMQEPNMSQVIEALRKSKCPQDVCCPIFGLCSIGIVQNSQEKQLQWCKTPCNRSRRQ